MSEDETSRIIASGIRQARDTALASAIELCEEFARDGGTAAQCVAALRDLRDMLPKPPERLS